MSIGRCATRILTTRTFITGTTTEVSPACTDSGALAVIRVGPTRGRFSRRLISCQQDRSKRRAERNGIVFSRSISA
jgi:hypothetical protein